MCCRFSVDLLIQNLHRITIVGKWMRFYIFCIEIWGCCGPSKWRRGETCCKSVNLWHDQLMKISTACRLGLMPSPLGLKVSTTDVTTKFTPATLKEVKSGVTICNIIDMLWIWKTAVCSYFSMENVRWMYMRFVKLHPLATVIHCGAYQHKSTAYPTHADTD